MKFKSKKDSQTFEIDDYEMEAVFNFAVYRDRISSALGL